LRLRGEVIDTGIGLSRDQQSRLFQPFTQLSNQAGSAAGGVGLGLAICRSIVEQMGGSIGVDSSPGSGSTFWFELPVRPAGESGRGSLPDRQSRTTLSGSVLVAEDTASIRDLLVGFLKDAGCTRVAAVQSGTELLRVARGEEFDLLLVDRRLPGMDGVDAIRELRADERTLGADRRPIVVVTASVLRSDLGACLDAGADAVVQKPLELDYLASVLSRWLSPRSLAGTAGEVRRVHGRSALVADDHEGNRNLVRMMLEEQGFAHVVAVADGDSALAACERETFDLLLLDWSMPGPNGLAVLQRVRERERSQGGPACRIVMVTGRITQADVDECMAAGADACVPKPYTTQELLDAVQPDPGAPLS
jgi:CheY-like chemotaxis protein